MSHPETCSLSAFAGIAGFKRSYITQLRKDGRLVLVPGTTQVRVAETLAKLEATRDPSKAGVVARHTAARAAKADDSTTEAPGAPYSPPSAPTDASANVGNTYQAARAVRERYLAMSAKRDYEVSTGRLLEAAHVDAAAAAAITEFRTRLESLPYTLGPQLAAIADEAQAIATLAETFEHMLEELAAQFSRIATQQAAA